MSSARKREATNSPAHTLEDLVSVRIARLSDAILRMAARTFEAEFGLRNTDLRILNLLDGTNGVSVNEIARRAHVDKAWISRSLNALVERGLVERRTDKADSRVSIIGLTAEGQALLERVRPITLEREARLLVGIDGEAFKRELDQLARNVEAMFEETPEKP